MFALLKQGLWESIHRRMGLAMLVIALMIPSFYLYKVELGKNAKGEVVVITGRGEEMPPARFAASVNAGSVEFVKSLWFIISILAMSPLLTTMFERGWVELLLAKGVARWQVYVTRYVACLFIFAFTLGLVAGIPVIHLWLRAGLSPLPMAKALATLVFNFAATLSLMALVATRAPSQALPALAGFVGVLFSAALQMREFALYSWIQAAWARWLIDWTYRILPKTGELYQIASGFLAGKPVESWWAVWSTAVFLGAALAAGVVSIQRRNF